LGASFLFLRETFSFGRLLGLIVILASVLLVNEVRPATLARAQTRE
jgi:drug/metabolite transporter (DMT)-like permease